MAFNPVEYQPANRTFVQGNVVKVPDPTVSGGFSQFGGMARGIGDLAYGIGAVGSVIDNWGAGKRREKSERDSALYEQLQHMHDDNIDAILNNPEQLEALAKARGYSAEEFASHLQMAKGIETLDRQKMEYQAGFDPEHNPSILGSPQEGQEPSDVSEEELAQAEVEAQETVEEGEEEFVGPTQEQAGLDSAPPEAESVYDPASEETMDAQMAEYNARLEASQEPNIDVDMENELQVLENPHMKVPDPARLEEAQKFGSQAYNDVLMNRKMFAHVLRGQAIYGQTLDPKVASDIANRMAISDAALQSAMQSYALEHMDHIPPSMAPYFNDPEYFQAAVDFERYNSDPRFKNQVDGTPGAKEDIFNKVRQLPMLWKRVYGQAVVGSADKATQNGIQFFDQNLKEEAQKHTQGMDKLNYEKDMMIVGQAQQKINMDRQKMMFEKQQSDREFELEWKRYRVETKQVFHDMQMDKDDKVLEITLARARHNTSILSDQSQLYQKIGDVYNIQNQTSGGKLLLELMKAEFDLATASAEASQKHYGGGLGDSVEGQSGSKFTASDVQKLHQYAQELRGRLLKEHQESGVDLFISPEQSIKLDVRKDLKLLRGEMFQAMGIGRAAYENDMKALEVLRDRYISTPGMGSPPVPPKLQAFYDSMDRNGVALTNYENNFPGFKQWLKKHGFAPRDTEALFNYHQRQVRTQQTRAEEELLYGS